MKVRNLLALGLALLLLGAGLGWDMYQTSLYWRAREKFGLAPVFFWKYAEADSRARGEKCYLVGAATAHVHWNWRGEMWQDPYFLWEDITLLSPAPDTVLEHGRTGPVRVGDVVCGWSEYGWLATIYEPDGSLLNCRGSTYPGPAYERCSASSE